MVPGFCVKIVNKESKTVFGVIDIHTIHNGWNSHHSENGSENGAQVFGSSMTNFDLHCWYLGNVKEREYNLNFGFEVANTIVKGANLMQSLSEDNVRHLKEVVLPSKGVQTLISRDMDELLRIAAADKRIGFKSYTTEAFQKASTGRYGQLMTLVQSTAELCYELHMLDRLEQDYQRRLKGDGSNAARRDDEPVESSRKNHKKLGPSEAEIQPLFSEVSVHLNVLDPVMLQGHASKVLRKWDSALQDPMTFKLQVSLSRSSSVPQHMRDTLYQGLPSSVKSALRSKLQLVELTVPQIKTEMKKTLEWLVPIAKLFIALAGLESGQIQSELSLTLLFAFLPFMYLLRFGERWKHGGQTGILRIETLHHADKAETEACIFKLVVWLQHLISQSGASDGGMPSTPVKTLNQKTNLLSRQTPYGSSPVLTDEDQEMLQDVSKSNLRLRMSRSQNHASRNAMLSKQHRLSKSSRDFLSSKTRKDPFPVWSLLSRPIDFDNDRIKLLDVIDGVDTIKVSWDRKLKKDNVKQPHLFGIDHNGQQHLALLFPILI
ncbi:Protein of unknown function D [Prunus dulcis]|uniref:Uncharacterized protein n=1 Tax=Prunus dulcis TaxID=3755 RepID=A0A4Y1RXE4_PRUDU|nr:Protein of unknown function D [Prunus dulcis]